MTNESVRDGASPRSPKAGDPARQTAEPATADATPEAGPAVAAPVTDWLAAAEPTPAPAADWLASEHEATDVETGFEPEPEADEEDEEDEADEADEEAEEAEEAGLTLAQRLRRISPAAVILGVAAIGSLGFLLAQLVSHTAPIIVLISASSVTGIIYVACAVACAVAAYRAAKSGRAIRSYILAFVGGSAAIIGCGAFAGAALMYLALGF